MGVFLSGPFSGGYAEANAKKEPAKAQHREATQRSVSFGLTDQEQLPAKANNSRVSSCHTAETRLVAVTFPLAKIEMHVCKEFEFCK